MPGSTSDHPMPIRRDTRESPASVLLQSDHLLDKAGMVASNLGHLAGVVQYQNIFRDCHKETVCQHLRKNLVGNTMVANHTKQCKRRKYGLWLATPLCPTIPYHTM